jgi:hypothetical protein
MADDSAKGEEKIEVGQVRVVWEGIVVDMKFFHTERVLFGILL